MKNSLLWDITSCRRSTDNSEEYVALIFRVEEGGKPRKKATWSSYQAEWNSCLAYSSNLKLESIWFSETSVDFQRTTCRCITEDDIFVTTAVRTSKSTYSLDLRIRIWHDTFVQNWSKSDAKNSQMGVDSEVQICTALHQLRLDMWAVNNSISVVPWGNMLQAGTLLVRFPMRSLDVSIYLILPPPLWPWSRLSLYQKWVSVIFLRGNLLPTRKPDNLTAICEPIV
jgi:hypothetical protein